MAAAHIDRMLEAKREKAASGAISSLNPLRKGLNSTSLRESINAHCYMCMGGEYDDPTTRHSVIRDVRECASAVCPLLSVRAWQ